MKYNNAVYFYRKDAQGNIIALLDSSGNTVVKYRYDAWGNHAVLDANGADITDVNHIGVLNPFRYRGYFYDVETGLYYLQTRYYDPEIGRFITIDGIEYLDPKTINGLNLYAYCGNNPVMNVDPNGNSLIGFLIALAIGALVTSIVSNTIGEHFAAGVSSTVSGVQTVGVGISLLGFGPLGWVLGGIAIVSGGISLAFAAAEFQEHFTGENYIKAGVSESWYNGIYITNSVISLAVTVGGAAYMKSMPGQRAYAYQNIKRYTFANSAAKHLDRPYYNSIYTQQSIIKTGIMTHGSNGSYYFRATGYFNKSYGIYEIKISNKQKQIWHFVFKSIKG